MESSGHGESKSSGDFLVIRTGRTESTPLSPMSLVLAEGKVTGQEEGSCSGKWHVRVSEQLMVALTDATMSSLWPFFFFLKMEVSVWEMLDLG